MNLVFQIIFTIIGVVLSGLIGKLLSQNGKILERMDEGFRRMDEGFKLIALLILAETPEEKKTLAKRILGEE